MPEQGKTGKAETKPLRDTPPYRLSAELGENMNQFAASKITNCSIARSPNLAWEGRKLRINIPRTEDFIPRPSLG
jgi:hypothetical protein